MNIIDRNIEELKPAEYNPRRKSEHVIASIKESLGDYGWLAPVVVNKNPERLDVIVGGHRRIEAARERGETTVPTIEVNLSLADEKRANLRLNAQEEFDKKGLSSLIAELHELDADKAKTLGFSDKSIADLLYQAKYNKANANGMLATKFLIPPFSVFDAKQGRWQKRKNEWLELLGNVAETRTGKLAKGERNLLMMYGSGVSSFDPVISELMYLWFLPKESKRILDPFAGGLPRGGVAAALGFDYTGIEIRKEQIDVNEEQLSKIEHTGKARFIHADAKDLGQHIPATEKFDMVFTCPPYYDLEIYSGDEKDLSAKQSYKEFMADYTEIFKQAVERLANNRFAIVVIGDIRDERGFYRNFVRDNITMMESLGLHLYNEIVYLQMLATAPHRAERNMRKRKTVKTHQNILTFYKGDELIQNPQLIDAHVKVLAFLKGDPETIAGSFETPPPIEHDVFAALEAPPEEEDADDRS